MSTANSCVKNTPQVAKEKGFVNNTVGKAKVAGTSAKAASHVRRNRVALTGQSCVDTFAIVGEGTVNRRHTKKTIYGMVQDNKKQANNATYHTRNG